MAVYDLEEQEQIENFKAWWNRYGTLVTWILCVLAIASVGWQGWQWRQNKLSAEAGTIFMSLQQAINSDNVPQVKLLAGELTEKFGSTSYAPLGVLLAAKHAILMDDPQTARLQLAWVVKHGGHEITDIARLRLAGLLLDAREYEGALRELEPKPAAAFAAAYAELRGDIHVAEGKLEEARAAYREAVSLQQQALNEKAGEEKKGTPAEDTVEEPQISPLLQQKLDALGGTA
ncbi:MAG: tetratricopeptide repeat protein [Zoogloeaceae bacterium]|jgi:predicted negative regulator of RcsB-dependent stress response|nr:tetratricopeptide repeat protein [Zoogloeaceae bacterium]